MAFGPPLPRVYGQIVAVDTVIFDWGGTLSHWVPQERVPEFWKASARSVDPDRVDDLAAHLLTAEEAVWAQVRGAQRSGRLEDIVRAAAAAHDLEFAEDLFAAAAGSYFEAWELELHHKADALPTLAALKSMGLRTGLLSNTHWPRQFHEQLLERDGLHEVIDERLYTSELTHVKPHPLAFKAALNALGAKPERTVFVGDRLYDDIYGAKSSGMRAVLVLPRPEGDNATIEPDATIHQLSELIGVIDGWLD